MRAYLPKGVPNYVTKEGLDALKEELKDLEAERLKAGDNYIMSNFIEAKMKLLISRINNAVVVDLSKANKDVVSFGAWVRFNGRVVRIVGVDEADVDKGLISFISPLAKSLTGRKVSETFELKGPRSVEKIAVEEVSFEPMPLTQMASMTRFASLRGTKQSREETGEGCRHTKSSTTTERRPREIVEEIPEQIPQSEPIEEKEVVDVSVKTDGSRRFEPEVNNIEFLPIVNERGNIVGRAMYVELHSGNKMLHPVAHLHVINGEGETTRLYWWHVAFGDTPEKTLKRKMAETLGLSGVSPKLKRQYIREAKTEKELVYVFTVVSDEDLPLTPEGEDYFGLFAKD